MKDRIVNYNLSIYLLLIPFFDVPKFFTEGLAWSFFFGSIAITILLFSNSKINYPKIPTIFFLAFLSIYIFCYFINIKKVNEKSLNHIIYYSLSFFTYYILFYISLCRLGFEQVSKIMVHGLLITTLVGTLEIGIYYTQGFNAYSSFLDHGGNVGIFAGIFPRMRSLFNEPSHLAIYLIGIIPFIYKKNIFIKSLWAYCLIMTFATSTAFATLLAVVIFNAINIFSKPNIKAFIALSFTINISAFFYKHIANSHIFEKITNIKEMDPTRWYAFKDSLPYLLESPFFGSGPAFYYKYAPTGLFNLYLQLFIEGGLFLLALFLFFIFLHIVYSKKIKYNYIMPILIMTFSYISMNHYYLPGLWILFATVFFQKGNLSKPLFPAEWRGDGTPGNLSKPRLRP